MPTQNTNSFKVVLDPDKRAKSFRVLGSLLIFLNAFVLYYLAFANRNEYSTWLLVAIIMLPVLVFIVAKIFKRTSTLFALWIFFGIAWSVFGNPWLSVINFSLIFVAWRVMSPSILIFTKQFISTTILFRNRILWSDLVQAILKDGLLTLDFKNNRILQRMIDETNFPVNQQEFNDFCSQQLKS